MEAGPITFALADGPSNGSLTGSGAVRRYTPDPGFIGSDSFVYNGFDGQDTGGTATVLITVTDYQGRVWAWGGNSDGQPGDGTTSGRITPVPVSGLWHIVAVDGGGVHSLAAKDDGTVRAWGGNNDGQTGGGTTQHRTSPVFCSVGAREEMAVGALHSLGIEK